MVTSGKKVKKIHGGRETGESEGGEGQTTEVWGVVSFDIEGE